MIKIRFYCWWKYRVDKLKIMAIEIAWDITALYFYFGLIGFELAIKIDKCRIKRKFKNIEYNGNFGDFT